MEVAPSVELRDSYESEVVFAVDDVVRVIRIVFGPVYVKTGGGSRFHQCMRVVTTWPQVIFDQEADVIFAMVPYIEATMIGAVVKKARCDGREFRIHPGLTGATMTRDIIRMLVMHAVDEPSVLSGEFFSERHGDRNGVFVVGLRLLRNVVDAMVASCVVFETRSRSLSVIDATTLNQQNQHHRAEDGGIDDISPDDSVSVANSGRPNPRYEMDRARSEVRAESMHRAEAAVWSNVHETSPNRMNDMPMSSRTKSRREIRKPPSMQGSVAGYSRKATSFVA